MKAVTLPVPGDEVQTPIGPGVVREVIDRRAERRQSMVRVNVGLSSVWCRYGGRS